MKVIYEKDLNLRCFPMITKMAKKAQGTRDKVQVMIAMLVFAGAIDLIIKCSIHNAQLEMFNSLRNDEN
jgi:hypothetical protein